MEIKAGDVIKIESYCYKGEGTIYRVSCGDTECYGLFETQKFNRHMDEFFHDLESLKKVLENRNLRIVSINNRPIEKQFSDTDILNWLQKQNENCLYSNMCCFRQSKTGRGWRLHSIDKTDGDYLTIKRHYSVREAIMEAMRKDNV